VTCDLDILAKWFTFCLCASESKVIDYCLLMKNVASGWFDLTLWFSTFHSFLQHATVFYPERDYSDGGDVVYH